VPVRATEVLLSTDSIDVSVDEVVLPGGSAAVLRG
jgi:hypothetical protein